MRIPLVLISAALMATNVGADVSPLVVHEWGTFTSFQDDEGATISGINVDDEPVPDFVHRLKDIPIFTPRSEPARWSQGAPRCHPDVTLRLETPVIYFYPQQALLPEQRLEVRATFVGGWLTEFFPSAVAGKSDFPGTLDRGTRSSLLWSGLRLATEEVTKLPQTKERVWLAPRNVRSAVVVGSSEQEAEKYLFYRGVGHLDAPLVVRRADRFLTIALRENQTLLKSLPPMWIVRVLPDGRVLYRRVHAVEQLATTAPLPIALETSPSELDALKDELSSALIAEGLFEDEAQAMLETWQLSYFDSEGLRLFFVLPRAWTDAHLPLSVSVPSEIVRVMLGRIELISSHQRAVLERLLRLPAAALEVTPLYREDPTIIKPVFSGTASHAEAYRMLGREVPEALQLYDSLGRFRDALLAHQWRSASDDATRVRLDLTMAKFSSCVPTFSQH